MFKKMVPRDEMFYDMFDQITANIVEGVTLLHKMTDGSNDLQALAQQLKTVEHQTDEIIHKTLARLHKTFVTPLDREQIHQLLVRLDDILDLAYLSGSTIEMYRPKSIPSEMQSLVNVLLESAQIIQEMVAKIRTLRGDYDRIMALVVEINRLESEADYIRRTTLARLFREERDVVELIKWKDILAYVEKATDRCEDVGNIVEGIVLENT